MDSIEQLDDFLNSKGIKQNIPVFTPSEEHQIQKSIEEVVKPAFKLLANQLNSYKNIKAEVTISKDATHSVRENIHISIYKSNNCKFRYYAQFVKNEAAIMITGKYCIPNFYGECANAITATVLNRQIAELVKEEIVQDFTTSFMQNVELPSKH